MGSHSKTSNVDVKLRRPVVAAGLGRVAILALIGIIAVIDMAAIPARSHSAPAGRRIATCVHRGRMKIWPSVPTMHVQPVHPSA